MTPGLNPALLLVGLCLAVGAVVSILALLASFGGHSIRGSFRCFSRGQHEPFRHPLGGFRCRDCGLAGSTLTDFGHYEHDGFVAQRGGYVTPPAVTEARAKVRDVAPPPIATDLGFYRPARRRP
jgi:hypothetical protein